jgi:hypothetical protein
MSVDVAVFTLNYGGIELVIAEHTLSSNSAPFTIIAPPDGFNSVEDSVLLAEFQSHFHRLEELVPKSVPMLRAYATLIMFYRISKNPDMDLSHDQAKTGLMGANADDNLLFIVAKLLRHDDAELRRYLQQPHILVSSLHKLKHEFILGNDNVVRLFQRARVVCDEKVVDRLTMKEFKALYQEMDPVAANARPEEDGKEEKEQKEEQGTGAEGQDGEAAQTATRSRSASSSSPSLSSKSPTPVYRSSSSRSSSRKHAKTTADTECGSCQRKDRASELMLCDGVDCKTACHYDCCAPPLSAVPKGNWFCAACKLLVRRALEEEQSLVVRTDSEKEKKRVAVADDEKKEDGDQVEEITAEQWQQKQEEWQREKEQYKQALAAKDAEVDQLRAEVERFKRQRVEREEQPMEEERKEASVQQSPAPEEQKETSPRKEANPTSNKQKRRGLAR